MTILLIDSVHSELNIGLIKENTEFFKTCTEQRQHDKNLNKMVRELLAEQQISFEKIDAYAVVVGPGSWTGCRVGVAAVKAFAFAVPRPVIALNSLEIIGNGKSPVALVSNLDNFYIFKNGKFTCEKLKSTDGYITLNSIEPNEYCKNLVTQTREKFAQRQFMDPTKLEPFYITNFTVK